VWRYGRYGWLCRQAGVLGPCHVLGPAGLVGVPGLSLCLSHGREEVGGRDALGYGAANAATSELPDATGGADVERSSGLMSVPPGLAVWPRLHVFLLIGIVTARPNQWRGMGPRKDEEFMMPG
jgi:hypothetical protein